MSQHTARISWKRNGAAFTDSRYSRVHTWAFDGGLLLQASSSPANVPVPMSSESAVDPEEAFVAALSSCHMLWFLYLAAKAGYVVEDYRDEAYGTMGTLPDGRRSMVRVNLRPAVRYAGRPAERFEESRLHDEAHHLCFLASAVRSEIIIEPVFP